MALRLDETDRKILAILLDDATISRAEMARKLGIAPPTVFERLKRLQQAGVIRGYEARLDAAKLGYEILAFIFVAELKPKKRTDTGKALSRVSGVEEVYKIAGEDCYLVKLRARTAAALGAVLDDEINAIPTVSGVRTTIVLKTIREGAVLSGVELT